MSGQTKNGKAFEYAVAHSLSKIISVPIVQNPAFKNAQTAYVAVGEKLDLINEAAEEACELLVAYDQQFKHAQSIYLQADSQGVGGDVRDIVITLPRAGEIGLSVKHNHHAVKHPRLSDKIDFGEKWAGLPCSPGYFENIQPVFQALRQKKEQGILFNQLVGKNTQIILPVLELFKDEFELLYQKHGTKFISSCFRYWVGQHDFYKIIKENKIVGIQPFNLNGKLLGARLKIPEKMEDIKRKQNSLNTLLLTLNGGWQISFRLHSASLMVEPSLKFDIQFVGVPQSLTKHPIPLNQPLHEPTPTLLSLF